MNKNLISAKQMRAVVSLYLIGSSLVTGASSNAGRDSWFCGLVGFLVSIPLILVHTGILNLYPGRNYYENILTVYGRIGGKIVISLLSFYMLYIGSLVLRIFGEFISVVSMIETPLIAISACIVGVAVYLLKNRSFVMARVSKFVIPLLYVSVFFTCVLAFKDMNFDNIKPVLHSGPDVILKGCMTSVALPFGEVVVCAPLFEGLDRKRKVFPTFFLGVLFGFLVLFVAYLRNLFVLGYSNELYPFASYEAVSVISYGEFFTRIEVLIGINLLLAGFIKVCVLIFSAASGISKILGQKDYVPLIAPCGLLLLMISLMLHSNSDEMYGLLKYLPAFSVPFQIVIPVLTLIIGTVKKKMKGKGKGKSEPLQKPEKTREETEPQR